LEALEHLAEQGAIDLFYGDEATVSERATVPYAWQFLDEKYTAFMPTTQGASLKCFALVSRDNRSHLATTQGSINAQFVYEQLDLLALSITKPTVVVLDNATPHKAKLIEQARDGWAERGLTIVYLPRYSPHLNIVEHLWKHLKYFWLTAEMYSSTQVLFYHVRLALAAFGTLLTIEFSPFGVQLNDLI
jgi:transposase